MPDKRNNSQPKPDLPIGTQVETQDGSGSIINYHFRKNTNGGPGTKEYVVRLNDGRNRHYPKNGVWLKVTNPDGYKEFGKAVTRLSPKELEDLFKGHKEN
jgi:hypothetical protein